MSSKLLIQEIFHGVFALPLAYLIWVKTKSFKKAILVILLTYLIDIDHFLDYFLYYGMKININDFLSASYFEITKRAIVPFHAWEWALILAILAYKKGWASFFTILLFSLLPHLIYDSITVGSAIFYSIIYRADKGFVNLN